MYPLCEDHNCCPNGFSYMITFRTDWRRPFQFSPGGIMSNVQSLPWTWMKFLFSGSRNWKISNSCINTDIQTSQSQTLQHASIFSQNSSTNLYLVWWKIGWIFLDILFITLNILIQSWSHYFGLNALVICWPSSTWKVKKLNLQCPAENCANKNADV